MYFSLILTFTLPSYLVPLYVCMISLSELYSKFYNCYRIHIQSICVLLTWIRKATKHSWIQMFNLYWKIKTVLVSTDMSVVSSITIDKNEGFLISFTIFSLHIWNMHWKSSWCAILEGPFQNVGFLHMHIKSSINFYNIIYWF